MRRKATVRTRVLGKCDLEFGPTARGSGRGPAVLTSRGGEQAGGMDVGGRIPPPAVVACQRLRPDAQRSAYISGRVPPLARLACQGLWPDAQRPAHFARRVPPLAVRASAVLHCRRSDRHGGHRRQRHHDDGNQMTSDRPHCRPPQVCSTLASSPASVSGWGIHHRTQPGHKGQDHPARWSHVSGRRDCMMPAEASTGSGRRLP